LEHGGGGGGAFPRPGNAGIAGSARRVSRSISVGGSSASYAA